MTPQDFAYWLQGFIELNPEMKQPTEEQWKSIREHLQLVFTKVTPPVNDKFTLPSFPPGFTPTYPTTPNPGWPWFTHPGEVTCKFDINDTLKTTTYC